MAGDTHYGSVALLLHCDGANASKVITDSSPSPKVVTAMGDAQISTAKSKFGVSSALFDGTGDDYLQVLADSPVGTGDFCLEMWVNPTALPSAGSVKMLAHWLNTTGVNLELTQTGSIGLFLYGPGLYASGGAISAAEWSHIALVRDATLFRVFVNGVQAFTLASSVSLASATLEIGYDSTAPTRAWIGNMDEIRLTLGVARYSSAFTAPTAAFLNYAGQVSGVVRDGTSAPVSRTLRAYNRASGAIVAATTSDPVTGAYTLNVVQLGETYVVCLDDAAGTTENDLILRTTPA